jgi:hypothetical protein
MATSSERGSRAFDRRERRGSIWTGRALSGLVVLFLLFDAIGKVVMPPAVMEAFLRLGIATGLGSTLAALMILSALLYAIPWTAVLGAVMITGYLGGAVAIHLRAGSTLFETIFPALLGIIAWAGIVLRDRRLQSLLPFRTIS